MNQVMLSVHCASMLANAEKFRVFLVGRGYSVFLCNQMDGGVNYRTQICENATHCKVFVAFMNEGWCRSKECEYEFNIAVSVNLESPTRTPYIIPILLEPFSVYNSFPAIRGFLRNCNGTMGNPNEMDDKLWNTVLAIIQKQIQPQASSSLPAASSPSPASPAPSSSAPPSPSIPHHNAPSSPLVNPYARLAPADTSRRSNLLPDVTSSPVIRGQRANQAPPPPSKGSPGHHPADGKALATLTATALKLIEEIIDFRLTGMKNVLLHLSIVRLSLEKVIDPQAEASLRALMDCLCKIKETCTAAQYSTKEYPAGDKLDDVALKLAAILDNPSVATSLPMRDFILEPNASQFWERNFQPTDYSVPWANFEKALMTDATYRQYVSHEAVSDLRMRIDHYNTGYVVCHRLSDFVGTEPFSDVLLRYRDAGGPARRRPGPESSSDVQYPLLLWADDNPEGNEAIIAYAKANNVNVVLVKSTAEAKQWLTSHTSVMDEMDLNKFHIITDNVRQGANTSLDLNAGEDLIRFVRGRRSPVPILVYCSDPTYAQYTAKYKNCRVATRGSQCQQFVDEIVRSNSGGVRRR